MERPIEGAIHEIERELHFQRYDCGIAQLSTGLRDAMKTAVDTMRKYQKIQTVVNAWTDMNSFDSMIQISEVIEDGND